MNILGIDPGMSGGIVLLSAKRKVLEKEVMPVEAATKELDRTLFVKLLRDWETTHGEFQVFIERIKSYGLSTKGSLTLGRMIGSIETILGMEAYPMTLVEPANWSKELHEGIDSRLKAKAKSEIAANRLFPKVELKVKTKNGLKFHDGLMDALLIAEYGRRRMS